MIREPTSIILTDTDERFFSPRPRNLRRRPYFIEILLSKPRIDIKRADCQSQTPFSWADLEGHIERGSAAHEISLKSGQCLLKTTKAATPGAGLVHEIMWPFSKR